MNNAMLRRLERYNQQRILKAWMLIALANGELTPQERKVLELRCETIMLPSEWIDKLCQTPPTREHLDYSDVTRAEASLTQSVGYAISIANGTSDPQKENEYLWICEQLEIPDQRRIAMEKSVKSLFLSNEIKV